MNYLANRIRIRLSDIDHWRRLEDIRRIAQIRDEASKFATADNDQSNASRLSWQVIEAYAQQEIDALIEILTAKAQV